MVLKEQVKTLKKKASDELSGQSLKDRLSNGTISDNWKKVRNVSGVVCLVATLVAQAPVAIPVSVLAWINYTAIVSGVIAGRAHLDKSKK